MSNYLANSLQVYIFNIFIMESNQVDISSIKISYNSDNQITLIDPIDTTPEFKKLVWFPYMKDLFSSLQERTPESSEKGIKQFALHSVHAFTSSWNFLASLVIAFSEFLTLIRTSSLTKMNL